MKLPVGPIPSNPITVTKKLLRKLKVNVSTLTLRKSLEDHPEFPSLLAISDCLMEWRVSSQAYKINQEDYNADDLLFPFIAHLNEKVGKFILITKIVDKTIFYEDELTDKGQMEEKEFIKRWTGVALHATATNVSGEKEYATNVFKSLLQRSRMPLSVFMIMLILLIAFGKTEMNIGVTALIGLKTGGTALGVLLLMQSINSNNPFISNLCSLGGKNDCNAILKSDAAKVTSWLSWSEIGFFYFCGSLISMLLAPSGITLLAWLNIFALPYTIYSLSYQYRHKNWCILCCGLQGILILEAIAFKVSGLNYIAFEQLTFLPAMIVSFLIPILGWSFLKPLANRAAQLEPLKGQLKKFKYNSVLFEQALKNQPKHTIGEDLMPLNYPGNEHTVIKNACRLNRSDVTGLQNLIAYLDF